MIIRVSDQLRCGEISLFEKDPEEVEEAKARLEAGRAQRRERYTSRRGGVRIPMTPEEKSAERNAYREANKERINARKQEYYAKNKENILAKQREYKAANKEKRNAKDRERYALKKKLAGEIPQE
ncbi:MAG: hypothetical protein ACOZF2_16780 [Thermodesulfobacteriota bacterium]